MNVCLEESACFPKIEIVENIHFWETLKKIANIQHTYVINSRYHIALGTTEISADIVEFVELDQPISKRNYTFRGLNLIGIAEVLIINQHILLTFVKCILFKYIYRAISFH